MTVFILIQRKSTFTVLLLNDYYSYLSKKKKKKGIYICTNTFRSCCSVSTTCSAEVKHQRHWPLPSLVKIGSRLQCPAEGKQGASCYPDLQEQLPGQQHRALPRQRVRAGAWEMRGWEGWRAGTGEGLQGALKSLSSQAWEVLGQGRKSCRNPDFPGFVPSWVICYLRKNTFYSVLRYCIKWEGQVPASPLHISLFPISAGWPQYLRDYRAFFSSSEAALASLDRWLHTLMHFLLHS